LLEAGTDDFLVLIELESLTEDEVLWLVQGMGIAPEQATKFFHLTGKDLGAITTADMQADGIPEGVIAIFRAFMKKVDGWKNPDPVPKKSKSSARFEGAEGQSSVAIISPIVNEYTVDEVKVFLEKRLRATTVAILAKNQVDGKALVELAAAPHEADSLGLLLGPKLELKAVLKGMISLQCIIHWFND